MERERLKKQLVAARAGLEEDHKITRDLEAEVEALMSEIKLAEATAAAGDIQVRQLKARPKLNENRRDRSDSTLAYYRASGGTLTSASRDLVIQH